MAKKTASQVIEQSVEAAEARLAEDIQDQRRNLAAEIVDSCFDPPTDDAFKYCKLSDLVSTLECARRHAGWSESEIVRGR